MAGYGFNYFSPAAYQYQGYPQGQQPPQMVAAPMQPQPIQPAQQQTGIIWVQGEAGAKAYPVPNGGSVLLMDSESQRFYIKAVDLSGMPQGLRKFTFVEEGAQTVLQPAAMPEYITRKEFEDFKAAIAAAKEASHAEPAV